MDAVVDRPRKRYERRSTGKRQELTPRAFFWFEKLYEHGPLTSDHLIDLAEQHGFSRRGSVRALTGLFHEDNTPHGGPYLDKPQEQYHSFSSTEQDVYDLNECSIQALKDKKLIPLTAKPYRGLFDHRLMVACVTASIEIQAKNLGLRFIPKREIAESFSIPCTIYWQNDRLEKPVMPDGVFALEYPNGIQRLFFVECDRNMEPIRRASLKETSYLRKILQYREIIGKGQFKELYPSTRAVVLNVFTNTTHMQNALDLFNELSDGKGNTYMLCKTLSLFADKLGIPKPIPDILTEPYFRAGHEQFDISK